MQFESIPPVASHEPDTARCAAVLDSDEESGRCSTDFYLVEVRLGEHATLRLCRRHFFEFLRAEREGRLDGREFQCDRCRYKKAGAWVDEQIVYIIEREGLIKVGYTRSPLERYKSLRPEVVHAQLRGRPQDERGIHRMLAAHRVEGEWFRKEGLVLKMLKLCPDLGDGGAWAFRKELRRLAGPGKKPADSKTSRPAV